MERIYMDYAATTFCKDEVIEAMQPYWKGCFGNASGLYESGRTAGQAVDAARKIFAQGLHAASKKEIYFTSCGTESDNWALKGVMDANRNRGNHLITTAAEHHAVLHTCEWLAHNGCEVTVLPVDRFGMVTARQIQEAIRPETVLVSVIYANNEVGSINPIAEIGEVTREAEVIFHTDAVQAAGCLPINVTEYGIDLLSLSAHKFYGPKGTGVLYCRNGIKMASFMHGGAQEHERRAGTENVAGIVGAATAYALAQHGMKSEGKRLSALRDAMFALVKERIPEAVFHGHMQMRLPGNVNLSIPGIPSEAALLDLDLAGIECSSGSACTSGSIEPSHVLLAMGVPQSEAKSALRFTFGATTTKEQIETVVQRLCVLAGRKE